MSHTADGLRALLERYEVKQIDLAEAIGATAPMVSRWVNGERVPTMRSALKVLKHLRKHEPSLTLEDLFKGGSAR